MSLENEAVPGQNGTKKWVEKYGDKLVTVRYRYDEKNGKRYTTVEIIAEEGTWRQDKNSLQITRNPADRLGIRVAGYEKAIRKKVKQAGGIWRPRQNFGNYLTAKSSLWSLKIESLRTVNREQPSMKKRTVDFYIYRCIYIYILLGFRPFPAITC